MSDTQDSVTSGDYEDQFRIDNLKDNDDNGENQAEKPDPKEDYKTLQAEMKALKEQNELLLTKITTQVVPDTRSTRKEETVDFSKNPNLLLNAVDQKLAAFENKSTREFYDKKVYEDFPILKSNQQFIEQVKLQMGELVKGQEYSPEHPKLVYRAAQLAASKMGITNKKEHVSRDTTLAPSGSRGVSNSRGSSMIKDTDPRMALAVAAGIKDERKLNAFKKHLESYGVTTEEHMRSRELNRGKQRGRTIGGGR